MGSLVFRNYYNHSLKIVQVSDDAKSLCKVLLGEQEFFFLPFLSVLSFFVPYLIRLFLSLFFLILFNSESNCCLDSAIS